MLHTIAGMLLFDMIKYDLLSNLIQIRKFEITRRSYIYNNNYEILE